MNSIRIIIVCLLAAAAGCASDQIVDVSVLEGKARSGDLVAQNDMGSRYQTGDGVRKDYQKAIQYYQQASDLGAALATANLGYMYDFGLGVPENNEKAIELYKISANAGEPRGMLNLGGMYGGGEGIERDYVIAYMWFDLARFYTQNSKDMDAKWASRGALDNLSKFMTLEQIKLGKAKSNQWAKAFNKKRQNDG